MSFKRSVDGNGRSVIIGLTYEETIEFKSLDQTSPTDSDGNLGWYFQGGPITRSEQRWLELYEQHRLAMCLLRLQSTIRLFDQRP